MPRLKQLALLFLMASSPALAQASEHADAIVVYKAEHRMVLLKDGKPLKTYKVSLGPNVSGPKTRQGDGKTPEGHYVIDHRNPHSHYYRSLHVSYPNAADRARAKKLHVAPGGDIMIHGLPNGYGGIGKAHLMHDWTAGCVAVTDEEIDEIWNMVADGTPVDIKP